MEAVPIFDSASRRKMALKRGLYISLMLADLIIICLVYARPDLIVYP